MKIHLTVTLLYIILYIIGKLGKIGLPDTFTPLSRSTSKEQNICP